MLTPEAKYDILVRNIRRVINDTVDESETGEVTPVYTREEIVDEIDLAIDYIYADQEKQYDISTIPKTHFPIVILRVWALICKAIAFDSAKFFYMQQTSQSYDKGQRTQHYLEVAKNLEALYDKAEAKYSVDMGTITVGDIKIIDRDTLQEKTAIADSPPDAVQIVSAKDMSAVKGYKAGDWLITWERSYAWDFQCYKLYKGTFEEIDKNTGTIVETIPYNDHLELVVNLADVHVDTYFVLYVLDNRDHFSPKSDPIMIQLNTGSV